MSVPPQVNAEKSGKQRAAAMKEPVQAPGEVYYGMGPPALELSHSDGSSGVYNTDKGPQTVPHYHQAAQVKWTHSDPMQAPGWTQEAPLPAWGQNFGAYMGGVNVRGQVAFHKGVHEGVPLPMGGENQLAAPVEMYREAAQAQGRGLEWEQHAAAAMHQVQAYQQGHKGVELQGQPHVPPHTLAGSILQPFHTTFKSNKQQFPPGYYPVFHGNKGMASLAYSEQPKTQHQLLHQMQQQQQQQQQMHQQKQQQQLHQQHHLQLQQQQQQQQHLQPQQQQQQQQQHQIQQQQIQQQQLQQLQQHYHQQQQLQERRQQIQQMQQLQQQSVPQQDMTQLQVQPKQQQTQNFIPYQAPKPCPVDAASVKVDVQPVEQQQQGAEAKHCDLPAVPDPCPEKVTSNPVEPSDGLSAAPRRSRRLSRDGQSPLAPPSTNVWSQVPKEPPVSQNGVAGTQAVRAGERQVTTGGVIQSTRRRRRTSKEINLETLAQKASEMESLPSKDVKHEDGAPGKMASVVPLIIPVSVPVHRSHADPANAWAQGRLCQGEQPAVQSDRKPSVIVARRRSLRNSMSESLTQDGDNDPGLDEDGKSKLKRRPRPEPLIIPPPKPTTFIPASVYSSITSYQSHLRSPVRLLDNPLALPPYTPPPILSPVREGSGLYFSAFLSNIAASTQSAPLPPTPKSTTRSLLRTSSSEITPPVLPLISDATPVSLEPRINIGQQYQADIPDLQDPASTQFDSHKADLVWLPEYDATLMHGDQGNMENLMNMACSSVLSGGGTNQELVLHCLHECGGDLIRTLGRLMLEDTVFPRGHHLAGYHYSGSDSWTAEEKSYFNKGISAYRKDFFMVQKLVQTKTVAQCVEFYYTYKKQVKIGRNGILTYGPPDSPGDKVTEAVVDVKSSQQSKPTQVETSEEDKTVVFCELNQESSQLSRVARSLQAHDYAGTVLVLKEHDDANKEAPQQSAPHRPRSEPAAKKSRAATKPPQDPEGIFPCKKCGRVFYKVKSRSAHMKSHAEQEKKAAALRQKEEEEQAAAEARARRAASALVASHQGEEMDQGGASNQEDSSEVEDDNDEDWH